MKVKKQEQIDLIIRKILDGATAILAEDGLEQLSIRKLSARIGYTPGNIYHYFDNKEAILAAIAGEGYQKIVEELQQTAALQLPPQEQLALSLERYIRLMLRQEQLFQILLLRRIPCIEQQVNVLEKGISLRRSSLGMLCACLQTGTADGSFCCEDIELTAQSIWCSAYGLITRILIEQPAPEQQERLIRCQIKLIIQSLTHQQ